MIRIDIDRACCKGCDLCIKTCQKGVFVSTKRRNDYGTSMPGTKRLTDCTACHMCEKMCPDGAISIEGDI